MTGEEQAIMNAVTSGKSATNRLAGERNYGHLFTALLFALFVVTLLLAIMAGTGVYRALYDVRTATDDSRLGLSLLANNVRANDSTDAVAVGAGPEGRSLVLTERLSSGTYETRIYLHEGAIVEEYALADAAYTPEKATHIVDSTSFDFSYANGLLTISTDQGSIDVMLRSVRGGA